MADRAERILDYCAAYDERELAEMLIDSREAGDRLLYFLDRCLLPQSLTPVEVTEAKAEWIKLGGG